MAGFFLVQNSRMMPKFGIALDSPRLTVPVPVPVEARRARASQRVSRSIRNDVLNFEIMEVYVIVVRSWFA